MAVIHQRLGREALPLILEALAIKQQYLRASPWLAGTSVQHLAEDELLGILVAIAIESNLTNDERGEVFLWALRRKGVLADTHCRMREELLAAATNPKIQERHAELRRLKGEVSRLSASTSENSDIAKAQIRRLKAQIDEIQAEILNTIRDHGQQNAHVPDDATIQQLSKALPVGSLLVEFVRYSRLNDAEPFGDWWAEARYAAFVLSPDGRVQLVDLDEAKEIESQVETLREAIAGVPDQFQRGRSEARLEQSYRELAAKLYTTLFGKLTDIDGAEKLLISPDGALHGVPFGALVAR